MQGHLFSLTFVSEALKEVPVFAIHYTHINLFQFNILCDHAFDILCFLFHVHRFNSVILVISINVYLYLIFGIVIVFFVFSINMYDMAKSFKGAGKRNGTFDHFEVVCLVGFDAEKDVFDLHLVDVSGYDKDVTGAIGDHLAGIGADEDLFQARCAHGASNDQINIILLGEGVDALYSLSEDG